MTKQEKHAKALEYFSNTLNYEHQQSAKIALAEKARNIKEIVKEVKTELNKL